ncbi:MAG: hypothetical protein J6031_01580 [Bacteroidales bacterium]|nr:hypothetical protein [Bacteroidales bacterium]
MNKRLILIAAFFCVAMVLEGCSNKDPHRRGIEAGKAACECYKLDDAEAVENCLNEIEIANQELLTDTAYTNAVESQLLECITDGVIDIVKPIKEAPQPKAEPQDTTKN